MESKLMYLSRDTWAFNILPFFQTRDIPSLAVLHRHVADAVREDTLWYEMYSKRWPARILASGNRGSISRHSGASQPHDMGESTWREKFKRRLLQDICRPTRQADELISMFQTLEESYPSESSSSQESDELAELLTSEDSSSAPVPSCNYVADEHHHCHGGPSGCDFAPPEGEHGHMVFICRMSGNVHICQPWRDSKMCSAAVYDSSGGFWVCEISGRVFSCPPPDLPCPVEKEEEDDKVGFAGLCEWFMVGYNREEEKERGRSRKLSKSTRPY